MCTHIQKQSVAYVEVFGGSEKTSETRTPTPTQGTAERKCKKGAIAKTAKGRLGVVDRDPNSDNDVTLRFASGEMSGYIKAGTLIRPCRPAILVPEGTKMSTIRV